MILGLHCHKVPQASAILVALVAAFTLTARCFAEPKINQEGGHFALQ